MTTEIVKSTDITNRDATPPVRSTSGKHGAYSPVVQEGSAAIANGVTAAGASYYRLARIPSNAVVKKVEAWLDAAGTTITGDIGIYYSSQASDETGLSTGLTGVINSDHFASAVALAAVVTPTDYTFEAGTYLYADTQKEVWQASGGLTADPGGEVDVVFTLTSTAGSAAVVNMRVTYTMPYIG